MNVSDEPAPGIADWLGVDETQAEPYQIGRSELERYTECPRQALILERGEATDNSDMATAGAEGHDLISQALVGRIYDGWAPGDVADYLRQTAAQIRPDVQHETFPTVNKAAWWIANIICRREDGATRHPDDVMRFDGGQDDKSGQIAWLLIPAAEGGGGVIATFEADLLVAGTTETHLTLYDWKTGWKQWSNAGVRASFQFQFYAAGIFHQYPDLQRLDVKVAMPRYWDVAEASFTRLSDFEQVTGRVLAAYEARRRTLELDEPEAWPTLARCQTCPVASTCPALVGPVVSIAEQPEAFFGQLTAAEARVKHLTEAAREYVKEHGDIKIGDKAWGCDKPPSRPSFGFYKPRASEGS